MRAIVFLSTGVLKGGKKNYILNTRATVDLGWKIAMENAWRDLSTGMVHPTPLIKNERAASAMVSPWDDGEPASPRRGEANGIGDLYPSKFSL